MFMTARGLARPTVQVLFAWPDDWSKNYEKGERFVSMLRGAVNARKAVMVLKGDKKLPTLVNPVRAVTDSDRRVCFILVSFFFTPLSPSPLPPPPIY